MDKGITFPLSPVGFTEILMDLRQLGGSGFDLMNDGSIFQFLDATSPPADFYQYLWD